MAHPCRQPKKHLSRNDIVRAKTPLINLGRGHFWPFSARCQGTFCQESVSSCIDSYETIGRKVRVTSRRLRLKKGDVILLVLFCYFSCRYSYTLIPPCYSSCRFLVPFLYGCPWLHSSVFLGSAPSKHRHLVPPPTTFLLLSPGGRWIQ
jgi:hypothetical protein